MTVPTIGKVQLARITSAPEADAEPTKGRRVKKARPVLSSVVRAAIEAPVVIPPPSAPRLLRAAFTKSPGRIPDCR
jgi:hypothetical protein